MSFSHGIDSERRLFLRNGALLILGLLAQPALARDAGHELRPCLAEVLAELNRDGQAEAISATLRQQVSAAEARQEGAALLRRIESLNDCSVDAVMQALQAMISGDYASGDIVDLHGWQLSATEIRLFLLAGRPDT